MKKIPLLFALFIFTSLGISAQESASYRFDNFDTRDGVRVAVPRQPKPAGQSQRLRLTARSVERAAQTSTRTSVPLRSSEAAYTPSLPLAVGQSLNGFSTGDANTDRFVVESATRNGVDPVLLYAIMHRESSFRRFAVSPKGARGLMQLMPSTAERFGVTNSFDPAANVYAGTRYLRWLLQTFDGNADLAVAAYNAGEGNVWKYKGVPPFRETLTYIRRIAKHFAAPAIAAAGGK
jgi:soluble lytic murein transglycosylase-like protein